MSWDYPKTLRHLRSNALAPYIPHRRYCVLIYEPSNPRAAAGLTVFLVPPIGPRNVVQFKAFSEAVNYLRIVTVKATVPYGV